jgi:hypothetical protein
MGKLLRSQALRDNASFMFSSEGSSRGYGRGALIVHTKSQFLDLKQQCYKKILNYLVIVVHLPHHDGEMHTLLAAITAYFFPHRYCKDRFLNEK